MGTSRKKSKKWARAANWATHASVPGLICTAAFAWISTQVDPTRVRAQESATPKIVELFELIHLKTLDFRFRSRGETPPHPRVAILAVDDESIERVGRWPWPRSHIARLIDNAVAAGAKVIGFDAIFSEPDPNAASRLIHEALIRLKERDPQLSSGIEADLRSEILKSNFDLQLAQSIQRHSSSVVMGTYFEQAAHAPTTTPLERLCQETVTDLLPLSRYWRKEKIQILRADPPSVISAELKSRYQSKVQPFLKELETAHSTEFLQTHPETKTRLLATLKEIEIEIPEEILPFFLTAALFEDQDLITQLLESQPEWEAFNNPSSRSNILTSMLKSIETKDLSTLRENMRQRMQAYCDVALTEKDPLLSKTTLSEALGIDDSTVIDELWNERNLLEVKSQLNLVTAGVTPQFFDPLYTFSRTLLNIPSVATETVHSGYFNANIDQDGVVRQGILVAQKGDLLIPALSFKMFLLDQNLQPKVTRSWLRDSPGSVPRLSIDALTFHKNQSLSDQDPSLTLTLPVDDVGRININYAGPQKSFPHIRASSLIESVGPLEVVQRVDSDSERNVVDRIQKVDRNEFLKDKLLIFGVTAMAVYDLRQTPFDENFPGVETHANSLSNLLYLAEGNKKGGPMRAIASEGKWITWAVIILGLSFSILLAWMNSLAGLALSVSTIAGLAIGEMQLLFNKGIVVNSSIVIMSLFANYVLITFYKYFTEERNKRELKGTFAKYVSPAVVDEILKDPENIELGGKKTDLTVMFSDVRGFTTISEKLDPRALSDLLNSYLTPMTELVFSTQGTLDKYMGDAIMAFWGAPIALADHPHRACLCALKMIVKLEELKADYKAKGLPEIDIGIGLNTGEMSVGNMGSNTVRSYTVMGDSVNLGSRLEGINKEYGTRIIISEFTESRIRESFVTREVDWVRVKGKIQPVRIYELLGHKTDPLHMVSPQMLTLLPHFNEAFQAYHARDFDRSIESLKRCLEIKPDDAVSLLYVDRIQALKDDPPQADWDGVFVMKTK